MKFPKTLLNLLLNKSGWIQATGKITPGKADPQRTIVLVFESNWAFKKQLSPMLKY
jgi:hypothetical protein